MGPSRAIRSLTATPSVWGPGGKALEPPSYELNCPLFPWNALLRERLTDYGHSKQHPQTFFLRMNSEPVTSRKKSNF